MVKRVWRQWIKVATVLGTFQMIVVLTVVYWTALAMTAVPYRLFADPLSLRSSGKSRWIKRTPVENVLDSMRSQG